MILCEGFTLPPFKNETIEACGVAHKNIAVYNISAEHLNNALQKLTRLGASRFALRVGPGLSNKHTATHTHEHESPQMPNTHGYTDARMYAWVRTFLHAFKHAHIGARRRGGAEKSSHAIVCAQ